MNFAVSSAALLTMLATALTVSAGDLTVRSGPARASLIELFTSEGCSSCPPADHWLTGLRQNLRLWKDFVPVAFHVDYWDSLGWKDPFASRAFTNRQRAYANEWGAQSVYTPGFVLNGTEWRSRDLGALPKGDAGTLVATWRETGAVQITFQPAGKGAQWEVHAALLGFDLNSAVKAGENSGRKLVHDFVALSVTDDRMTTSADGFTATLHLPPGQAKHGASALAVWITATGKAEPWQAAGGPL